MPEHEVGPQDGGTTSKRSDNRTVIGSIGGDVYLHPAHSRKDRLYTALRYVLRVIPVALSLLASLLGFASLFIELDELKSIVFLIAIAAGVFTTLALGIVSGRREPQAEKKMKLSDISDLGVREVIGSATAGQAFLVAHLAQVQQSLKPGGAR